MSMRESVMEATDTLARFITDTHYDTLPEEVVSAAKIGIMDGVANMLAGATQPLAAVISSYVQQLGGAPQCSVVGHDLQTNAPSAANPMSRDEHLSKVRACARRSLQPADTERVIGMVETLETLTDLRQLMGILGHKSVP